MGKGILILWFSPLAAYKKLLVLYLKDASAEADISSENSVSVDGRAV